LISVYEVIGIKQSDNLLTYFALLSYHDPMTSEDVIKEIKWQKALNDEIDVIKKNNTQELTPLPKR